MSKTACQRQHVHVQALAHVAQRLAELHAAGYVHRDLKPANIMWLPREERWTLIDFGCVARAGVCSPLRFSLAYAAPEVVATAMQPESPGIIADAAFDTWSLGVIAFELLLGERAFGNNVLTKSEVRGRACFEQRLSLLHKKITCSCVVTNECRLISFRKVN